MNIDKWYVRLFLTVIVLSVSAVFAPMLVVLKLLEGVYVSCKIASDCIAQVWATSEQSRGRKD